MQIVKSPFCGTGFRAIVIPEPVAERSRTLLDHYRKLIAYNRWANNEVLKALEKQGTPGRTLSFMTHIVASEWLWLERLRRRPQPMPVWPDFDLAEARVQFDALEDEWNKYLEQLMEPMLDSEISYLNSKKEAWDSRIADVLTHLTHHSAYHRGQIVSALRDAGIEPPYTDYIHAVRRGLLPSDG